MNSADCSPLSSSLSFSPPFLSPSLPCIYIIKEVMDLGGRRDTGGVGGREGRSRSDINSVLMYGICKKKKHFFLKERSEVFVYFWPEEP